MSSLYLLFSLFIIPSAFAVALPDMSKIVQVRFFLLIFCRNFMLVILFLVCCVVQAFYYPWYGTPQFDARYNQWNHRLLPHWNAQIREHYPHDVKYDPSQDDIGSSFFPAKGCICFCSSASI